MRYLVSFFITTGLIAGIIFSKYFAIFLIFFSNIFFTAYSDAKIIVFLVYLAIIFLVGYIWRGKVNITKSQVIQIHISLFILALASVFSYIYITRTLKLPFNSVSTFSYLGGHDSTVGPFHIHTFKPIFTWLLTLIGVHNVPYYGSGLTFFQAFRELQPLYMVSFLLLLYTIYLFVRYGLHLGQKHGIFFLVIYAIFSYGVIKALVDGGPLWYETYLNYSLFCILVYIFERQKNLSQKKIISLIFASLIVIYIVLVLLQVTVNSLFSIQMLRTRPIVEYTLFLTGFGLILLAYNRKRYIILIFLCLISGLCLNLYSPAVSYISYGMKKIEPQDKVTIFSLKSLSLPLIDKERQLYLYRYKVKKEQNIFSVLFFYSHLFYRDISVDDLTCDSKKLLNQSIMVSVRQGKLKNQKKISSPFFSMFFMEPQKSIQNSYRLTYQYNDCLNNPDIVLVNHLQQLGFYSFVLHQ